MKYLKHVKLFLWEKTVLKVRVSLLSKQLSNSDFNQRRWCNRVSRANGDENSETAEYFPLTFPEAFSKAISNPLSGPAGSSAFTKRKHQRALAGFTDSKALSFCQNVLILFADIIKTAATTTAEYDTCAF